MRSVESGRAIRRGDLNTRAVGKVPRCVFYWEFSPRDFFLNFHRISSTYVYTYALVHSSFILKKEKKKKNGIQIMPDSERRLRKFSHFLPYSSGRRAIDLDTFVIYLRNLFSYHFIVSCVNRPDVIKRNYRKNDVTLVQSCIERNSCPIIDIALSSCLYIFITHCICSWITDIIIDVRFSL